MAKNSKLNGKKRKYKFVSGKKTGLPPGSLVHTGDSSSTSVKMSFTKYGKDYHEELIIESLDKISFTPNSSEIQWYDFIGVHDKSVLEKIGSMFNLHPLVLEDIMNTSQRPKIEEYEGYSYIVLRKIHEASSSEQISIILGDNYIISFQEHDPDSLTSIKQALESQKSRLRGRKADYLAYRIIDVIIDEYFSHLESLGERIESLEEEVTDNPQKSTLNQIHGIKRELILLRRSIWPAREVIGRLTRTDDEIVSQDTRIYLRDVYDHTIQVIDTIESYRDITASLLDIYLSSISNRMGEVMKVLTVIATIFIPLTFIAGVYGMNFLNMPELEWEYGYFMVLAFMGSIMIAMLIFFRRKEWI